MTGFTADVGVGQLILPLILQGIGMGLIFVPVSTVAFTTLPKEIATEAAGIYSLIRAVGSALGISLLATYFSRSAQQNWGSLRSSIDPFNPAVNVYLAPLHLNSSDPQSLGLLAQTVMKQAQNAAYIDSFWFTSSNFVLMLPLLLLVKTPKIKPAGEQPTVAAD